MVHLPYTDRLEAGRLLAASLSQHNLNENAIILALPRGGVPVGFAVADRLHLPLNVIVARKLGVPWQPELAMGAIAGTARVLDERMLQALGIDEADVEDIVEREQAEMKRREAVYRGTEPPPELNQREVILVDDGLATGSTMVAAARHARSRNPSRLIVAVPVGSEEACERLRKEADEVVCLAVPRFFMAVGEWYRDFQQVDEKEVQYLLEESRRRLSKYRATQSDNGGETFGKLNAA